MFIEQQMLGSLPHEVQPQHDGQPITPRRPQQQYQQQQQHPAESCPVRRKLEGQRRLQAQQMQCDL